ncbi:virulence factor BrkB family protein [Pseudidiomarina sp.]|uniref:virulence factor BrkB family protein n=1 Tax=Pseudidiomarina sp. TaxID=2081707 RepID=UPI0039A75DB2
MTEIEWRETAACAYDFVRYFVQRVGKDHISTIAGYLTFVSLLALVPLLVVMFSIFSAFPMFDQIREQIESFLFSNLVPTSSEVIEEYLNRFIGNVSEMTVVGAIFVIVVAINLISTIDSTINRIWRTDQRRRLAIALAVYWMILTLGPLLIGSGVAVSSYLISLTDFAEQYVTGIRGFLFNTVPFVMSVLAFLLLYVMMPNRVVRVRHAVWGALLAASLFELSKLGFGYYITSFTTYEAIYGALAALPILLIWIFLFWTIVLLGAEFTVSIEEFFDDKDQDDEQLPDEEVAEEKSEKDSDKGSDKA